MPKKPAPVPTLDGLKIDKKKLTERQQRILAQLITDGRLLGKVKKVEQAIDEEKDEDALIREHVKALAPKNSKKKGGGDGRGCSGCELKGTRLTAAAKKALGEEHTQDEHKKWAEEHQKSSRAL